MLSIIITAFKEERTIGRLIETIINPAISGIGQHLVDQAWEIIISAPDTDTLEAAKAKLNLSGVAKSKFKLIQDKGLGKPIAVNLCLEGAKGDYLLLTDGDVELGEGAVEKLMQFVEDHPDYGGVSGRPVSRDAKTSLMLYWGNLLADAAHHKRNIDLSENPTGKSTRLIPKRKFFPLSGYLFVMKNIRLKTPEDCLIEDAYFSYQIYNLGYKLGYQPDARVLVKYANNLKDYLIQKKRSTGGYMQLWKYGVVTKETKSRSFWRELEYAWFPLRYATNLKESGWSLLMYPVRLWLWIAIFWERKIIKKSFSDTWERVESTK